jgi:hypothetical protein
MRTRQKVRLYQLGIAGIVVVIALAALAARWYALSFPAQTKLGKLKEVVIAQDQQPLVGWAATNEKDQADLRRLRGAFPVTAWGFGYVIPGHEDEGSPLLLVMQDTEGKVVSVKLPGQGDQLVLPPGTLPSAPQGNMWHAAHFLAVLGELGLKKLPEESRGSYEDLQAKFREWVSVYGD